MTEAQIRRQITKWTKKLGLYNWSIQVELDPNYDQEDSGTYARCWPNHEYETARIRFYLPKVNEREFGLEETIVHELVHCLMAEGDIEDVKREEHMVTLLTRAFLRASA